MAADQAQVALVTGASRGIGFAAAQTLVRAGFKVALNGLEGDDDLARGAEKLRAQGAQIMSTPFDVSDLSTHHSALSQIEAELGPLTTLINNAGIGVQRRGDPLEVSPESYDKCQTVNTRAMFFLCQAFSRLLLARPRDPSLFHAIVNVTSSNAVAVAESRAEYCVSKAGAAMVSKAFAVRLGRENIAVYDVQPGLIATEMTAPVIDSYAKRAEEGLTLLPRVGEPEEMGQIIASLASGKLPYTTGQVISADAGLVLQRF